jgi:hypothetical protein
VLAALESSFCVFLSQRDGCNVSALRVASERQKLRIVGGDGGFVVPGGGSTDGIFDTDPNFDFD